MDDAQVIIVASDQRQAGIIGNTAKRMVQLSPRLQDTVEVFYDHLEYEGSTLKALPAEANALEGWDPSMALIDELHVVTRDVFETVQVRCGKRDRSLLLAISTPPRDGNCEGVMWDLVERGRSGDDSFYFKEFGAPQGCAIDDTKAWYQANPALGDFLYVDGVRASLKSLRESTFRAYRLGQWPQHTDAWLPDGAWEKCLDSERTVAAGAAVVLGFDGSFNGDATVLVGCTIAQQPSVWLEAAWERPEGRQGDGWRVPVVQVEDAIRDACRRYNVREVACDPARWTRSIQVLDDERLPMVEFPQSPARMQPATSAFYKAVVDRTLTHDGDPLLARHIHNAVLKENSRGATITKESKMSKRHIDAAVAAIMAHSRAQYYATRPKARVIGWV